MVRHKKPRLVTQYLEGISREALGEYFDVVTQFIGRRTGIYALFRRGKPYYVGLASDLRWRLKHHFKDSDRDSWDAFSVYLTIRDRHLRELESPIVRMVRTLGTVARSRGGRGRSDRSGCARSADMLR